MVSRAVHEPHWIFLQDLTAVLAAIRGGHNPDSRSDNGRKLALCEDRLGPAQAIQALNDKHASGWNLAVLDGSQKKPERARLHVFLVVGTKPFVSQT